MKKLLNRLKIATAALLAAIFCLIYPMQTLSDAGIIQPQQESSVVYSQPEEIASLQEEQSSKPYIIGEDTSKRQPSSKHFLMSDGSYQIAEYPINVHYLNEDGQYEQYDNRIQTASSAARSSVSQAQTFKAAKADKEIILSQKAMPAS